MSAAPRCCPAGAAAQPCGRRRGTAVLPLRRNRHLQLAAPPADARVPLQRLRCASHRFAVLPAHTAGELAGRCWLCPCAANLRPCCSEAAVAAASADAYSAAAAAGSSVRMPAGAAGWQCSACCLAGAAQWPWLPPARPRGLTPAACHPALSPPPGNYLKLHGAMRPLDGSAPSRSTAPAGSQRSGGGGDMGGGGTPSMQS